MVLVAIVCTTAVGAWWISFDPLVGGVMALMAGRGAQCLISAVLVLRLLRRRDEE